MLRTLNGDTDGVPLGDRVGEGDGVQDGTRDTEGVAVVVGCRLAVGRSRLLFPSPRPGSSTPTYPPPP